MTTNLSTLTKQEKLLNLALARKLQHARIERLAGTPAEPGARKHYAEIVARMDAMLEMLRREQP